MINRRRHGRVSHAPHVQSRQTFFASEADGTVHSSNDMLPPGANIARRPLQFHVALPFFKLALGFVFGQAVFFL
jgi:hypothetical protein